MLKTIIDLLLIALIMASVHQSGFIENVDAWVGSKWKFHHLPYPVRCLTCGTWWLSLLYLLIMGKFSLLTVFIALVMANISDWLLGVLTCLKNGLFTIIEFFEKY